MANPEKGNFLSRNKEFFGGGLVAVGILAENPLIALVGLGVTFWPKKN